MSLRFPLSEFFESSGNAAAEFNENLRDGIATFACNLWSQYPGWLTEGTLPTQSFARGFMNQMCSPIQPAVPVPESPFTGGQCVGVLYNATFSYEYESNFNPGVPIPRVELAFTGLVGPIVSLTAVQTGPRFFEYTAVHNGGANTDSRQSDGTPANTTILPTNQTWSVARQDGMPDNCGNPNEQYPGGNPTSIDLTTNITINNLDGTVNNYELTYNKLTNQYNFPMNFKLSGTNVTLDLGGITIFGAPQITFPTSGNDVPPPGSDGGEDGVGGNNDTEFPEVGYPVIPDLVGATTADLDIEYLVCESGIIQTIIETIKVVPGLSPQLLLIVDLLNALIEEICGALEAEATVGLPEYYGLKPGVNRPAIVYLWKEFNGSSFEASTYSSTVHHPTAAAIAAIPGLAVPDKTIGPWVTSLNLTDGSRIRATGNTQTESLSNFNFLLNQVEPSFIPVNAANQTVVSEYPNLNVLTLKLRQIEYYPTGKQAGVAPFIRRVIQP